MCRSIKVLRRPGTPVTEEEIAAAALQYVRKVSGFPKPSKVNEAAFQTAVAAVAQATETLLSSVTQGARRSSPAPERDASEAVQPEPCSN